MKRKKIAFHFYNNGVPNVDFRKITEGNPGVGGTVFLAVLIPTLLASRHKIEPLLLSNNECIIPDYLSNVVCGDLKGALEYCRKHKDIDAIVIDSKRIGLDLIRQYPDVNIILWANNIMRISFLKSLTKLSNVIRIINVSKEQCDLYRDMNVYKKCTYIFNAFPVKEVLGVRNKSLPTSQREHNVVYVGTLVSSKGFHLLAQAWPKVLNSVPDAQLYIIGSGRLYNKDCEIGEWGIASPEYEKEIIPYLVKDGKMLPSVHFLGEMGNEKFDVLSKCKVGIPNPSGATETFGYTAIEMQAMGCFVTTKKCPGYIDTVYDKTQLYDNPKLLPQRIISLLNRSDDLPENVLPWIVNNFNSENIVIKWEDLLSSDFHSEVEADEIQDGDLNFHGKKIKEFIRKNVPDIVKRILIPVEQFYPNLDGATLLFQIKTFVKQRCFA
jgi:glycosyltransferase involved in cell wall biosynthesis